MELALSFSSSMLRGQNFLNNSTGRRRLLPSKNVINARENDDRDYMGKLVDDNMVILRMRLKDMVILETKHAAPSNWTEWEKQYFSHYNEDVCEAVGLLQLYLMNTRPCLALGIVTLFAVSVPISASVIIFHAMEMAKGGLFSGFHLA